MGTAFKSFDESMRESDSNIPYTVPDRSENPVEDLYHLPMREYRAVMKAREKFGSHNQANAIEQAFCGNKDSFINLNRNEEADVLEFLEFQKIALPSGQRVRTKTMEKSDS